MPYKETIASLENREFIASVGNWNGDMIWQLGPKGSHYGFAQMGPIEHDEKKTMTLSYPNISAKPNLYHFFSFYFVSRDVEWSAHCDWTLTDGVKVFQGNISILGTNDWTLVSTYFLIPPSWIKEQTVLKITADRIYWSNYRPCFDDFSLKYYTEITPQYLPIMGIG